MMISLKALAAGEHMEFTFTEAFAVSPAYGLARRDVPVTFEGRLSAALDRYTLSGRMTAALTLSCSRCLAPVRLAVNEPVYETFRRPGDSGDCAEGDQFVFEGEVLDISPALEMNLLLHIPMNAQCGEDCRGLCPVCGANLNEGECGCDRTPKDHRMDALRDLLRQPE